MKMELLEPSQLSRELRTATSDDMRRRRIGLGLSFAGVVIGTVVAAYQTGLIKRLPDILPGDIFDAEKVDASDYAYENLQTPDATLMIVNYGVTAALLAAGGKDRAEQNPAAPLAAAGKAAFDLATCTQLAIKEWKTNHKLCSWCQIATVISAATFALTLPEAAKALGNISDDRTPGS